MRRSALLAEASRVLSRSLEFDTILATLREAVVPALADACQFVLHDPNGGYWFAPIRISHFKWRRSEPRFARSDRDGQPTLGTDRE